VENEDLHIIRERVLDACTLIHFSDRLFAANPETPRERIAFELLRVWMDRVYTPSTRYMEGYKGDHDQDLVQRFIDAFDDDEYSYIERFHRFVEIRLDRLGESERKKEICRWLKVCLLTRVGDYLFLGALGRPWRFFF